MNENIIFPGQKVTCCGYVPATIICNNAEHTLLLRHDSYGTFIVALHAKLKPDGELTWDSGSYFTPYCSYTTLNALQDAVASMTT